ncbi:MAG TPA: DUF2933 domain-containing protein [Burkholderiales bacterium]|nr:DUF2933 domain-containing protein [Burkholderiales bacterium]
MAEHRHERNDAHPRRRAPWIFVAFLLIAAFFLIVEHRAHLFQWLPFLLLLACPLLHLFHGHGGHGGHGDKENKP